MTDTEAAGNAYASGDLATGNGDAATALPLVGSLSGTLNCP